MSPLPIQAKNCGYSQNTKWSWMTQCVCFHWKRTGYWCCMVPWPRKARLSICCAPPVPLHTGTGTIKWLRMRCFPLGPMDHQQAGKLEAVGIRGKTPRDFCSGESVQKGSTQPQSLGDLLPVSHRQIWGFQRNTGDFGGKGDQDRALHTSVDRTAEGRLPP